MNITFLNGYPDLIGQREAWVGYGIGPSSYNSTAKDVLNFPVYGGYVDYVFSPFTVSGTYQLRAIPSGTGVRQTWVFVWVTAATQVEVVNGTDLSAELVQVGGFSGKY